MFVIFSFTFILGRGRCEVQIRLGNECSGGLVVMHIYVHFDYPYIYIYQNEDSFILIQQNPLSSHTMHVEMMYRLWVNTITWFQSRHQHNFECGLMYLCNICSGLCWPNKRLLHCLHSTDTEAFYIYHFVIMQHYWLCSLLCIIYTSHDLNMQIPWNVKVSNIKLSHRYHLYHFILNNCND